MNKFVSGTIGLTAMLAACGGQHDTATLSAPTATAVPVAKIDPNAIDAPIPAESFKVKLALSGPPVISPDKKTLTYQVSIKNVGIARLYGVGKNPVNLGVEIIGNSGSADTEGGVRDFVRVPLPLVAPGGSTAISANVPVDPRLEGHKLRFALVQEGVAWHEEGDAAAETNPNSN